MRAPRFLGAFVALFTLAVAASSAWAQAYAVTPAAAGSQYVTPPGGLTDQKGNFLQAGVANLDDGYLTVTPPFPIPYFGSTFTSASVSSNGQVWFGTNPFNPYYIVVTIPVASGANDGICMVCSGDLWAINSNSHFYTWSDGTAPNRRYFMQWDNFSTFSYGGNLTCQVQFHESGKIVMSYLPSTWTATTELMSVGMDAVTPTSGIAAPNNNGSYTFSGPPPSDWLYERLAISGTVLYDRYVVGANGIGGTTEQNLPLANLRVEQRDGAGTVLGFGFTSATGAFNFQGTKNAAITNGSIVVTSGGVASNVRSSAGGPLYTAALATNQSFGSDISLGTITINESRDPGGVARGPINIARSIQQVFDTAKALTAKPISQLEVTYGTSISSTAYTAKVGVTPASMTVSGASSNPDPWDAAVIRKTYARHILGAAAADPGTAYDATFNKATDAFNAFAEAFGYYMNVLVSGEAVYYDGLNTTTTLSPIELESPSSTVLSVPASATVAGWVAASLFDLTDPANEVWDTFDGSGATGTQVFLTVQSMSAPVSAASFTAAWNARGYDAPGLARNFIHHGVLADDSDEPNDNAAEAKVLSTFGFVRTIRLLNVGNEDWYQFTMPDPTNSLYASVSYDRSLYPGVSLIVQLVNSAGATIGTGTPVGATGPIQFVSGALPAGTYKIRVALASGGPLPVYTVQAFSQLAFKSGSFQPWTVGRPINVPVNIKGGIPPFTLTVLAPFTKPDGLILDGINGKVIGNPTGPQAVPLPRGGSYTYNFILSAQDSASPPNIASGPVSFTVNNILEADFGEFIAFPFDKALDRKAPWVGGTAPYVTTVVEGLLPAGIEALGGDTQHFIGKAASPGSSYFKLTGTDIAGSTDSRAATGVVCVPFGKTTLAAAASACGFYFCAVEGTIVNVSVSTEPKLPRRALRILMLDADGSTPVPCKVKGGKGHATAKGFVAPSSGTFYCVVASDDDGAATQIRASASIVPTKAGKGNNGPNNFVAGKTLEVNVGALSGAVLTFTATPDRRSGLALKASYLIDPTGTIVLFEPGEVTTRKGSVTVKTTLTMTGTWRVVIGAEPGNLGHFTFTFRLKEPKGVDCVLE